MGIQSEILSEGKLFDSGYKTLTIKKFYIDNTDDIENLPGIDECLAGSKAIDTSTGDVYMMNTQGEWNKIFDSKIDQSEEEGGGSSSSSVLTIECETESGDGSYGWSTGEITTAQIKEAFFNGTTIIVHLPAQDETIDTWCSVAEWGEQQNDESITYILEVDTSMGFCGFQSNSLNEHMYYDRS